MPRYGMVINLSRCIGCRSCAVACKIHNSIPPGTWWHRVETPGSDQHMIPSGSYPNVSESFLPVPCMHCDNPACVGVCPVKATWSREDGVVLVDYERCIGCRYCMTACPYGVRQFNWQKPENSYKDAEETSGHYEVIPKKMKDKKMKKYRPGYPGDHRTKDGRLVYSHKRPKGVVEKCTFCVQYLDKGLVPTCVRGCPGNVRVFGDLDDPGSEISKIVESRGVERLLEEMDTKPKVFYISPGKKNGKGTIEYSITIGDESKVKGG
ncbi:MAG: 4Fe-4S dicluster domain-containing protein [bacterium]|nr:4Fe-4S dicluster domain-containing protein [bacterium]